MLLSMIASGVCDANAYYRRAIRRRCSVSPIKDERFPRSKEHPLARLAHIFPQAISSLSIPDHRLALTSYLEQCGIAFANEANTVSVIEGSKPALTATFDEHNRLTKLDAVLGQ